MRPYTKVLVFSIAIATVVALGACGDGGTGGADTPPAAPSNVTATPGPGYVDVSWDHDGERLTGFVIERRELDAATTTAENTSPMVVPQLLAAPAAVATLESVEVGSVDAEARSFRDDSVETGVSYRYGVRAIGAGGTSSALRETQAEGVSPQPPSGVIGSNPDPERFLAAIVRDGDAPVGDALVSGFLVEHGDTLDPYRMTATSGDAGVALLVDRQAVDWLPAGAYDALVSVWLASSSTYALVLVEDVTLPGTFEVDLADPALVAIDMTLDASAASNAWVEFGREVRDWTLYGRYVELRDDAPVTLLLEPLVYDSLVWLDWDSTEPTHLVGVYDLSDVGAVTVPDEVPDVALTTLDVVPPPSGFETTSFSCMREPRERHRHMLALCPGAFRSVPWTAPFVGGVILTDDEGRWWFDWHLGERSVGADDVVIAYGGEMVVTMETAAPTYQPGDVVDLIGSIEDAFGHPVERAQLTTDPITVFVHANLEVFAPDDAVVVDRWEPIDLTGEVGRPFDLPEAAVPGTYTVRYTFPTGPYQGDVVATTTFGVVTE